MTNIDLLILVLTLAAFVYIFKEWIVAVIWVIEATIQWIVRRKERENQKKVSRMFKLLEDNGYTLKQHAGIHAGMKHTVYFERKDFNINTTDLEWMTEETLMDIINKNR